MEEELLKPVTYGSIIYLSTESNLDAYMFSDGFVDKNVKLKSFSEITGTQVHIFDYYDFSFCLFMVLPFSSIQSFEVQQSVIQGWRDKLLNSPEDKLEKRKEAIAEMANKLESEFQFNLGIIQKSQSTSVCFASSNFMLLHLNSLKFLSLFQDDNNNLFLQLTENPDPSCFFNFDPSLKLQKGRSDNFVYEEEIVYISCAKKFSGKSPYLTILDDIIIGLIDQKENWKVNIYEEQFEETQYMRVGSCVWILSSEQHLFLNAIRELDPYYELYQFQYVLSKEDRQRSRNPFLQAILKDRDEPKRKFLDEPRKQLFDSLQVNLSWLEEMNEQSGETQDMSPFGLWKIESLDVQLGGEMRWDKNYRLKHVISGKYLSVDDGHRLILVDKAKPILETIDFTLVPIDNLLQYKSKSKSTQKISKDAFFWLQHKKSGLQIGFDENKFVKLYSYTKDVNTFRFKEATQQSVWENYSLNACQNLLMRQVGCCQNGIAISQMSMPKKEIQEGKLQFDHQYELVLQVLNFLKDFLLNRQIANMSEDEPIKPCKARQNRFREQYCLGLLCWLLVEVFPAFEEFEMLQVSPEEDVAEQPNLKSTLKKRKGVKYIKNQSYNFRQAQDHLIKKYIICKSSYELLSYACYENDKNQRFTLLFMHQLSNHIGFGAFVSRAFNITFGNNKEILEEVHRFHIRPLEPDPKHKSYDIFQAMAHRLKLFEPYQKVEILQLLSAFISSGAQSIYINQEKVYHSIVDNKNFLFSHLMKLIEDTNHEILVEYREFVDKEYESRTLKLEEFFTLNSAAMAKVTYFKEQLRLYSSLCQNRNYVCVKNMQELLPQKLLLKYLNLPSLPEDVKAILCSIILNLYVDQEPRSVINKPSFVRVFSQDPASRRHDEITHRFIELNLRDDIAGTYSIRQWLLDHLNEKYQLIKSVQENWRLDVTSSIYNELTYEVTRVIAYMIKFGLFTKYAGKLFSHSLNKQPNEEMENLIIYLAALLEFDFNYMTELLKNGFKRSYTTVVEEVNFLLPGNLIGAGLNMFQIKKQVEEEEEEIIRSTEKNATQSFTFLRRYDSLFRLIKHFTNKTCRNSTFEVTDQIDYTVLIKKQICLIFSDLFEWREDFYIENAIKYFEGHNQTQNPSEGFRKLMPEFSIRPNKFREKRKVAFEIFCEQEELKDFDYVLERPFVEVLIFAFYFAKNSELQNTIANLIYKRYTQREKLVQNLSKVSLVEASNDSYHRLSTLANDIKNLISYSQSWLQIIESGVYDEKAEETMGQTVAKFEELKAFWLVETDPEGFLIKQKVFKHLGGHKLILKFIESGIRVINSRISYFEIESESQSEFSYKCQFIANVLRVFQLSHQILSKFVEGNNQNQATVYKKYSLLVDRPVRMNIGQVEFLASMFLGNIELCLRPTDQLFKFMITLIKEHGHYAEYLHLFQIFLDSAAQVDSIEIQRSILTCLLKDYKYVDPKNKISIAHKGLPSYYRNPPDEQAFKAALIQIVCQCLQSDLSMNYVVSTCEKIPVKVLLEFFYKECVNSNQPDEGGFQQIESQPNPRDQKTKHQIYQILNVYFGKIDSSVQQLQDSCEEFARILKHFADKLHRPLYEADEKMIAECVIGLVNIYFEHFLKDIGMISLKMLADDPSIKKEKFIFEFAQIFVSNLNRFHNINAEMAENIRQLSDNFSIQLPVKVKESMQGLNKIQTVKHMLRLALPSKVEKRKSEYLLKWQQFVEDMTADAVVKSCLKEEKMQFPQVILNVQDIFEKPDDTQDLRLRELLVSKENIIVALLQYIHYWKSRGANKNTVIFILKSIRALLSTETEQERAKRQVELDSLQATQIALRLYWKDKQTEDPYIYELVKLIIGMLKGGNKIIQTSILAQFQTNSDSEAFFQKIYNVLTNYMQQMRKTRSLFDNDQKTKAKVKMIAKTLMVIQLLCEGHNTQLQNYLRQQTNSKASYDIVSLMVKLVISNRISDSTYESLLQCLETLTEVVQGPCKENQVVIVTSKFVSWAIDLLREDDKLFEQKKDQQLPIRRVLLNRLKYKSTVTLLSLMEMQEENDEIMNLMIRSVPCTILVQELGKCYEVYQKYYGDEYILQAFNTYQSEDLHIEANECIIEYGFNLFILVNILILKNKKSQDQELDEIRKLLDQYQFVKKKSIENLLDIDLLGALSITSMLESGLGALKNLGGDDKDDESAELKREAQKRKSQKDAFNFFSSNTVFIEILREEQLQRIYFPLLPQCKMLPKENKVEFHEKVDHSSIRDKLVTLMTQADYMKNVMEHEEVLRNLFKRFKPVELIATHKSLWENMAFLTNIILNFLILVSFSEVAYKEGEGGDLIHVRLYEPRLFFNEEYSWTNIFILIVGYLNLGFSMLVITFFAIKKAPLLIKDMWIEFWYAKMGFIKRVIQTIVMIIRSFINCLVDFDFAYYCGYMSCVILGLVVHPFIFVFLMADFLRIATLKIVIKAIWISRIQMGLSFLVFLLVEYYFTIIGYIYFHDQYSDDACGQMWMCFLETFDQTFKNGGAIGDYLTDTKVQDAEGNTLPFNYDLTAEQQERYIYRFVFDVLFKFILVVLIINMVAGIIIDTFGALKDDQLAKKSFLEDYCFICGIESEKLDKATQYGHYSHIKKNHYMWNYVFYKVYLFFKPKSELSGNETFVKRLMIKNDIDWFPIKQAMGFIDEDNEEEEEDASNLPLVEAVHDEVSQLEQMANQTNQKVKNF